jgi:hypothetical protein
MFFYVARPLSAVIMALAELFQDDQRELFTA